MPHEPHEPKKGRTTERHAPGASKRDAPPSASPKEDAPRKIPYYPGYFGTGEEEGVERERERRDLDDSESKPPAR